MNKFVPLDEDQNVLRSLLFEVLAGEKEDGGGYGFELGDVMRYVQEYLNGCYSLSINPLPALRRILPQFEWRFFRSKEGAMDGGAVAAGKVVRESDLIWMLSGHGLYGHFSLVTAISIYSVKPPRRLFFVSDDDVRGWAEAFEANLIR